MVAVKRVSILHRGHVLVFQVDDPFWKWCSNCGEVIHDKDIDKFLKKVEEHNCKEQEATMEEK